MSDSQNAQPEAAEGPVPPAAKPQPFQSLTQTLIDELRAERPYVPTILVVEDDGPDAQLMCHHLLNMKCRVELARTGEEAILKLYASTSPKQPDFDLVILDLKLPGMSGVDVLKKIIQVTPRLPVVVCTGMIGSNMMFEAARLGYIGLAEKPLRPADLREILDKHRILPLVPNG